MYRKPGAQLEAEALFVITTSNNESMSYMTALPTRRSAPGPTEDSLQQTLQHSLCVDQNLNTWSTLAQYYNTIEMTAVELHAELATFGSTVASVPQLRSMCSTVLSANVSGSGLKALRLVSKQMRSAMLGAVQGFSLQLHGRPVNPKEIRLLQNTSISYLHVLVTSHMAGEWVGITHTERV